MKKMMSLVALAVIGSVVAASAAEVLSANAVGYVKRAVPAGKLQIVSVPFVNMANEEDGTYKFGETQIANDLPRGSVVMFWDAELQGWGAGSKGAKGWSAGQANHVLEPGEAFFVKNTGTEDLEVTAAGEVPDDPELPRSYANEALGIMAYAYPVDVKFGDTELAQQLERSSTVMFWDDELQGWGAGTKGAKGWSAGQANYVVKAGEGFFIKPVGEGTWTAVKPYTWP